MKFSIRDLLLVTVIVALVCIFFEGKPVGAAEYSTPAEAFVAFQKGWKEKSGEIVLECVTEQYRDEILLAEWANEFSLRFPGPHILPIVSQHLDEKRLAELTRRELPTRRGEFASALSRSLDDPKRAFLHVVKSLDEKSRSAYITGSAADFTTDGNRGKAAFKFDGDSTAYPLYFVKDERGWHYMGRRPPLDAADPKQQGAKPPPAKPWTNGKAAKYASPQDAFSAFVKAFRKNEPETVWNCVTDDGRNRMLAILASYPRDDFTVWYFDMGKFYAAAFRERPGHQPSAVEQMEQTYLAMAVAIRDPQVLCSALVKEFARVNADTPEKDRLAPTLQGVVEAKDEAHGLVHFPPEKRGIKLSFKKVDGGWRLQFPPLKEWLEEE